MSRRRDLLTTRGFAFLAAGLTLLAAGLLLGFPDLTRVGFLLIALPVLAMLLVQRRVTGLEVSRSTSPARTSVDEPVAVTVTVRNARSRSTPALLAEDLIDVRIGERPRTLLGALAPGQGRTLAYAVRPPLRGRQHLGPLAVEVRDPFGLTIQHARVGGPSELIVLPRVLPLSGAPSAAGMGGVDGDVPALLAAHAEIDQSVREYRDGDDLRRIHWPATARTGDFMVRHEDRPVRRRATIVLDTRASGFRGEVTSESFEWAVSAAASVLRHLANLGYAVRLVTPETAGEGAAAVEMSPDAALDVLAAATLTPAATFAHVLDVAQSLTASGGVLAAVLATHDLDLLRDVARLRGPGTIALALLVDAGAGAHTASPVGEQSEAVLRGAGWGVARAAGPFDQVTGVPASWAALTRSLNRVGR
jgi:uncharacterized protein (DUF58 family)